MKTLFSIFALALLGFAVQAQEQVKAKPASNKPPASDEAKVTAPETAKEADKKMEGFDINFRHQVERTRMSIYTLGGRLIPAGKKPGEGC